MMLYIVYGFIGLVMAGTVIWAYDHKQKQDRDRAAVQEMLDYIEKHYP